MGSRSSGGCRINERPYDYWRGLFRTCGYRAVDWIRPQVARDKEVSSWYRYNVSMYVSERIVARLPDKVRSDLSRKGSSSGRCRAGVTQMPTISNAIRSFRGKTRTMRLAIFRTFIAQLRLGLPDGDNRILRVMDLGGTVAFWEDWWCITEEERLHITLINNHEIDTSQKNVISKDRFIENRCLDATILTCSEYASYDVIFSNSFFEHLASRSQQETVADNIIKSGRPYFIQVPNKYSPIDPHHPFAPFFALYPLTIRTRLLTLSGFGCSDKADSLDSARKWQENYLPLGLRDMKRLFPEAAFKIERPLGIPMSILAYRAPS